MSIITCKNQTVPVFTRVRGQLVYVHKGDTRQTRLLTPRGFLGNPDVFALCAASRAVQGVSSDRASSIGRRPLGVRLSLSGNLVYYGHSMGRVILIVFIRTVSKFRIAERARPWFTGLVQFHKTASR